MLPGGLNRLIVDSEDHALLFLTHFASSESGMQGSYC
jgi:hypothetical protein